MNSDILKGSWKMLEGRVKSTWGALTDDELRQIDGNYERLLGKIQAKYGIDRDKAGRQIDELLSRFDEQGRVPR